MAQEDAAKIVRLRNEFYRDSYRRVTVALLFSFVVNVALAGVLFYIMTHPPQPKYFATSINGRITKLEPLTRPNQSDSAVLQWANQAAIAAYTYNFVNYAKELQAASEFFTPQGWQQFQDALISSNNLDAVKAKKLIVSAVATRTPVILQKGFLGGRYAWQIQMTVLVTYQSSSVFTQEKYVITMTVTRVSTLDSPRGIGISQFVARPAGGGITN